MAANPSSENSRIGGASERSAPQEDDFIKWVKAHYPPHAFIPMNPLVIKITVSAPEDRATFYLATLTFNRKLGVKFSRLDLPLWHVVIGHTKRYLCSSGVVIIKTMAGGETIYFEERDNGLIRNEISFTTAEDIIQKDLEQKFLHRYLRDVANSLPELATCN